MKRARSGNLHRQGRKRGGQRFAPRAGSLKVAACSKSTSWLRTISPLSPCLLRLSCPTVVVDCYLQLICHSFVIGGCLPTRGNTRPQVTSHSCLFRPLWRNRPALQCIQDLHVMEAQFEIKELGVFLDVSWSLRPREREIVVLQGPA